MISRISRNFSREMGHNFSHLARNQNREKCAGLILTKIKFVKGQKLKQIDFVETFKFLLLNLTINQVNSRDPVSEEC